MTIDDLKKLTLEQLMAISRPLKVGEIIQDGDWLLCDDGSFLFATHCVGEYPDGTTDWYRPERW